MARPALLHAAASLGGVAAGFLLVAGLTFADKVPAAAAVLLAQAVGTGLVLWRPGSPSAGLGLGIACIAALASPVPVPLALLLTGCFPAVVVQFLAVGTPTKALALGMQGLVLAAMHATVGFAGWLYWLPLALGLASGAIAFGRVRGVYGRSAVAAASALALFLGYA